MRPSGAVRLHRRSGLSHVVQTSNTGLITIQPSPPFHYYGPIYLLSYLSENMKALIDIMYYIGRPPWSSHFLQTSGSLGSLIAKPISIKSGQRKHREHCHC
ncbi:unnamed protein product [Haemonchus placei]|uniref:Uncharacterized protein n=1 Tax=Haemonchus placei TaxID=6290 RepID=A0A0N4X1T8_HAEPC|nr:unnamed protein product [Haemonchus placei]